MTDCELLELAAKAAGYNLAWGGPEGDMARRIDTWDNWNPLTDDGDALRLAVILRIQVPVIGNGMNSDPFASTRRAIVLDAAEIGKAMK